MENQFIAIVGMCGAGKSIAADYLVSLGYGFFRFGQITLDEAMKRGVSGEAAEKAIREEFRKKYGMAAYAILNKPIVDKFLETGNVVGDGLYSWSEYKFFKETYGDKFKVLAIIAPPKLRYQRLEERNNIDEKMRNRPLTKEMAEARDYAEIENIEKGGPIAMADYAIINNSSKEDLINQLKRIFEKPSRPSWDEYFIKLAALVAERSTCLRHHVGAVIVKDKRVLTTGYNGAPKGVMECDKVGCIKDKLKLATGVGYETCKAIHAEQNAIIQAGLHGININEGVMYSTHSPCLMCAKTLINAGIKEYVTYQDFSGDLGAIEMLKNAGIIMRKVPRPFPVIEFKD